MHGFDEIIIENGTKKSLTADSLSGFRQTIRTHVHTVNVPYNSRITDKIEYVTRSTANIQKGAFIIAISINHFQSRLKTAQRILRDIIIKISNCMTILYVFHKSLLPL